jgi:hypothetical protein
MTNLNHGGLAAAAMSLLLLAGGCAGAVVNEPPTTPSRSTATTPAVSPDHAYDGEDPDLEAEPAPLMNAARTPRGLPRG